MVTKAKKKTKKKATKKTPVKSKAVIKKTVAPLVESENILVKNKTDYPQIKYSYGRPTKYQTIFCEYAIFYLSKGLSKEALAGKLMVTKSTLYDWIKKHSDFSNAITIGSQLSLLHWEENITLNHIVASKNGLQINGQVYALNMKNRFNWKDKQEIDLGEETKKTFGFKLDKKPEEIS